MNENMGTSYINIIYKLVYYLLHYFYTFSKYCHEFVRLNKYSNNNNYAINLTKMPQHLTVVLGTEEPSLPDLINLIEWCLISKIPFISFYDYKGVLNQLEDKFLLKLQGKSIANNVIWHRADEKGAVVKNGYKNFKIHVKIFGDNDGRSAIVDLCKQLAMSKVKADGLTIDNVSEKLREYYYKFPDPDLGLCCGRKTFSLFGYPPWEIRVTEFVRIETHHNFTFNQFVNLLQVYSKCEQRLGR